MPQDKIIVRGAREHNLKNIDVEIPRDKLVVITGLSGSGKSSLAFDTIYAEGQRRYVESLSAYARQFLGQMEKPDVDYIEGLSPAISIDQRGVSHNPRSTVGTVTEIYDYLRLLFARVGHPHCPRCGREIQQQTVEQIVDAVLSLPEGSRFMVMAPLIRDRKGEHLAVFEDVRKAGYVRVRVDGRVYDVSEDIALDKNRKHTIEVVVDRLEARRENGENPDRARIADSIETALKLGAGVVLVAVLDSEELLFSEHFACVHCGISLGEIAPRTFSFNSPHGACPACTGLGTTLEIDPELVIPNKELTIGEGAIQPFARMSTTQSWYQKLLEAVARHSGFSLDVPVKNLKPEHINILLYGNRGEVVTIRHENQYGRMREYDTTFEGVIPNLERRYKETDSDYMRMEIERYMASRPCPACKGQRLKPESLAVTVAGRNIVEVTRMSVLEALKWVEGLRAKAGEGPVSPVSYTLYPSSLTPREQTIAYQILKEIRARLGFLIDVGLDYLTIDRAAGSLSGGEAQRIRLATQIGSSLMGVLYILDEPSIGLHQRDNRRLIATLERLRDLGNTVLVVEHDEEMIRSADYIVDLGPGAGEHGGWVVVTGPLPEILACPESITAQYLRGDRMIPIPRKRRPGTGKEIVVVGARENNLKDIEVHIPLGKFVCITGVSGSGKSTLLAEIIYKRLAQVLYHARERPGDHDVILGLENLDKVVNIDQSPIGRTPRSNPATYTGAFTPIRELFATVPEARLRGYAPGRFSFNVKGGRCEACQGDGIVRIEMQFLPDVYVPCEVCKGKRYNRETLEIRYKGKTISEVLEMTVEEATGFFANIPAVKAKLKTLYDVGLGYIRLGQSAPTLSGGEAQRVKLSSELSRRATGRTLYILDEPTTGLHFADVERLLQVLNRLVDAGNSVLIIEHNLDVVKCADWIIDLGPEGGDAGGWVVAEGTPEEVARTTSYTGQFLSRMLDRQRHPSFSVQ
ncbi:MAG: excinuclease ABC subunit UvrA [Chloroflexota bacterium]